MDRSLMDKIQDLNLADSFSSIDQVMNDQSYANNLLAVGRVMDGQLRENENQRIVD